MMQIDTWCGVIVSAARPPCAQWQAPQSLSALYSLQATTNCSTSSAAWLKPVVPYLHGTRECSVTLPVLRQLPTPDFRSLPYGACMPDLACQCALTDRKKKDSGQGTMTQHSAQRGPHCCKPGPPDTEGVDPRT